MEEQKRVTDDLLNKYIFHTIGGMKLGVNFPDEDDSVMGYYDTREEAREVLKDWFLKNTDYKLYK